MWLVWLLSMVGLGVVFYVVLSLGAKSTIIQQLLRRKQTLARAQASNITSFFQVFGESVALRAQLRSMDRRDASTVDDLEAFVDQWDDSGLVAGVALTDTRGVVKLNANVLKKPDIGASLADRDYFVWAKSQQKEGEYFVGQPVISRVGGTKGQVIVPVVSPVYRNGVFLGAVISSVKLQPLIQRYLELIKVTDATEVHLLAKNGDILFDNIISDNIGTKMVNDLEADAVTRILNTTGEGTLKTKKYLIAIAPVTLSDQHWAIVMSTPVQTVVSMTTPVYLRQLAIFLLVSFNTLLVGIMATRGNQKRL